MAKTLSEAAKKWAADTKGKGAAYKDGVEHPRHNACDAFKAFVGKDSMAVKKYCDDYDRFADNISTYETIWTNAIDKAIKDNAYENGLERGSKA